MGLDNEINDALRAKYPNAMINVINESHLHAGHSGDDGTGESHWKVVIADPQLAALSRIARHRAIHAALGTQIIGRIHALAMDVS